MSLKRKIFNFFAAVVMMFGSVPMTFINTYADDAPTVDATNDSTDAPAHKKKLIDNGDGTYTLSLSVTGKASSSTTQEVTKSNVILLIDTSSSMTTGANGYNGSRLAAEKNALTKTDGIIDKLLANNGNTTETSDIIELYGINFGTGATRAWDWSTNGTTIKDAINGLSTNTGTNWEEALIMAKQAADAKHTAEPDDNTYVIFMTDGEPTTHQNDYTVNTNYGQEWGHANDDARAIVNAGYTFYGIFTFGSGSSSSYLKSLVNYAYTGSGTYNSPLSSDYAQYFYDATDTQALISALEAIVNEISSSVGYTNIAITDGLTDLTSSVKVDGKISNLTYNRSGGSYGSGAVWTNAPEATTTNGSINWNLGSTVLEDGVTYTVSFVVWPSQESYDLVADLNNGKKTYSELTDSQKTSVIENSDGSYTFKTNTDYPTLTYSTVTTTTSSAGTETVVSKPTTINIENPKPVGLKNEKLTLKKIWEDTLDPSQRGEVEEVVLDFYKDGVKYEKDIHLDAENDWTLPSYISIAPGIMISDSSANYDLLKPGHTEYSFDGKTYIILEEGHDYYFDEHDINNHFELTNYVYHPMLVDNEMKNVFFTRDTASNITGIEEFKKMDSVSATNTLKGGINIQKQVRDKGEDGEEGELIDTDDSFEITAHLIGTDGKPYYYDYRIYFGEKNPEYNNEDYIETRPDGSVVHRTGHIRGYGDLTETLYVGDVIRIVNVDSGVQYYVEETVKAGYDSNPVITYKEAYGIDAPVDSTKTEDGYYVVSGNTASTVTVTNKFLDEKTKVEFEKTWYDADGNVLSGKTLPGSITIELFKKGADGKKVSTGRTKRVTADTDWKGSFTDLPKFDNGVTIVYSVEESAIEGATYDEQQEAFFEYDPEENNGKHAVVGRWTVETLEDLIVKNTWKPATESVTGKTSFNIVKIDKNTKKTLAGATFELKLKDGTTFTATTNAEGKAAFSNLDAGEYTLKEADAPEGYKLVSTEPNINITKIKKLNDVDLTNLENRYEYVFSFSTSQVDGYEYDIESRTFTVEDEPIPYDDITASKIWDDDNDRDGLRKNYAKYYVAVKNNSGKYVAYEKLALINQDYTFEHLPTKTVDGQDISYEIVEASTCSDSGESMKCTEFTGDKNYTATVDNGVITNYHEPELINEDDDDPDNDGKLMVQKIWDGEGNELMKPTTITVELYANGKKLGDPVTLSAVTEWKHTFEKLYKNENGEPIVYTVEESKLGETAFNDGESTIVIYMDDNEIEKGQWDKVVSDTNITNTWTRNTANSFTIKKTTVGLKAGVLKDIEFTITGPEDFGDKGEMTLKIGNGCAVSGDYEITCTVDGKVPTGTYKVVEKSAEAQNFNLTKVTGDNGAEKKVNKKADVVFEIENKYEKIRDVHYKVAKVWDDDSDRDGKRLEELKITLLRNGAEYKTATLTNDNLSYEWTDLPRADENAEPYEYSVVEEGVDGYESDGGEMVNGVFTFTNTHKPELINEEDDDPDNDGKLTVQKIWDGEDNELVRPNTVTIELHAETVSKDGEVKSWIEGQPVTISAANEWSYTFEGLYRYDNGLEITYSVQESKIGEMTFDESESVIVVYRDDAEIENGKWEKVISGTDITNTWTRSLAKSFTIKKTTVGLKAEVLKDLEFTIMGPEDFGDKGKMTLKIGKGCAVSGDYEITCTVDGKVPTGVYTVSESNAEVENFTLTVSGDNGAQKEVDRDDEVVFEIKNKYTVDEVMYFVDKVWEDAHNKDGKRPEKLIVNLLANGEVIDTIDMTMRNAYILDEENGGDYVTGDIWNYVWDGLPYADENAVQIGYTVEEVLESDDYEQIWVGSDEYATTFVNYHEPEDPCAEGGCGGDVVPVEPPVAPETGKLTNLKREGAIYNSSVSIAAGGFVMVMLGGVAMMVVMRRKR